MSPPSFKTSIRQAILDWLWRGWNSVGVAGSGGSGTAREDHVLDVETLLLAATVWGRCDPRLFDEVLDWLCLHGSLVHMQRLKNLHAESGLGDAAVLAVVADVAQRHSAQAKWKSMAKVMRGPGPLEPFFTAGSLTGKTDPVFAAHGYQRGRLELRQMSRAPSPGLAANFWLKLRCLFGTSTRAEIMLHLLTGGPMTAAQLARLSGFTQRSVLLPLREMAISGHVIEPPAPPRERVQPGKVPVKRHRGLSLAYSVRADEWSFLRTWENPSGFPKYVPVSSLLATCQSLEAELEKAADESTLAIRCREAVKKKGTLLHQHGWSDEMGLHQRMTGSDWLDHVTSRLPALIQSL
jgi:hypothetical protein